MYPSPRSLIKEKENRDMIREDEPPVEKETLNLQKPLSFSSLPYELAENCLARISKWKYPNLSLVSKSFLSILSSPQLYKTRSHIGTTEPCIYFCLDLPEHSSPKWFTLWMKPTDDDEMDDDEIDYDYVYEMDDDYSLIPVPSSPYPRHEPHNAMVAVGSEIYLIGAPYKALPSSAVGILDCRTHTWRDGPSMLVARSGSDVVYLDEKIYVMGGCSKDDVWMEVFDIKTQVWRPLQSLGAEKLCDSWFSINVLKGRIYASAEPEDYAYNPSEDTWDFVDNSRYHHIDIWCVIDNVRYCFTSSGYCMWYDSKSREWLEVKGYAFEYLRTHSTCSLAWGCVVKLLNYGGKLFVVWIPRFEEYNEAKRRICCATIVLEKRDGSEVWGEIEWANTVLTVHKSYKFLSCVAISI